ncbi:MAG: sugar phosphate isomerase/epimerase family protein [Flavisolibacter sp.]
MSDRRRFLQQSGALLVGGLVLPRLGGAASLWEGKKQYPIGIQLYTLSDLMARDPKGTLKSVAGIGYKELESAATPRGYYYGYTPKELAAMARDLGMHWRSHHVMGAPVDPATLEQRIKKTMGQDSVRSRQIAERLKFLATLPSLKNDYQRLADEAAAGGISYLVCASIPVSTLDEIKTAADVFNKAGEACKKNKLQFAYHNHITEFDRVEGHKPFDYILSHTDRELVKMELDLAWATKAKQDPVQLFREHPGRFPLWHVKDIDKLTLNPTEVGAGIVDFKKAFDHAEASGMNYFFVEQDAAPQPLQNITHSYQYLKKLLA